MRGRNHTQNLTHTWSVARQNEIMQIEFMLVLRDKITVRGGCSGGVNDSMVADKRARVVWRRGFDEKFTRNGVSFSSHNCTPPPPSPLAYLAVRPTFPAGASKNDVHGTESESRNVGINTTPDRPSVRHARFVQQIGSTHGILSNVFQNRTYIYIYI